MKNVYCEVCGRMLYRVNDDGLILYYTAIVRKIDGVCECGHGFHYSVTDRHRRVPALRAGGFCGHSARRR